MTTRTEWDSTTFDEWTLSCNPHGSAARTSARSTAVWVTEHRVYYDQVEVLGQSGAATGVSAPKLIETELERLRDGFAVTSSSREHPGYEEARSAPAGAHVSRTAAASPGSSTPEGRSGPAHDRPGPGTMHGFMASRLTARETPAMHWFASDFAAARLKAAVLGNARLHEAPHGDGAQQRRGADPGPRPVRFPQNAYGKRRPDQNQRIVNADLMSAAVAGPTVKGP